MYNTKYCISYSVGDCRLGKYQNGEMHAEDLAVITYNNSALLFREKLSYLCVGHRAVHCSPNTLHYPQQEAK